MNAEANLPSNSHAAQTLPLQGVRVLELSQILAGPTCGLMLADLGAEVIKIERWPAGDDARGYRRPGDSGLAPAFLQLNRGKRSLAIDLSVEAGKSVLRRLVASADVMTENFRPGVMERLGLAYEQLRAINSTLIYASISGYGRTGPLAGKGGFDLILQAFSGIISVTGEKGGEPVKPGISVADTNAGILAAFGVLAAYVHRLKTGLGQRVDTSLLQATIQQNYWFAAAYFSTGQIGRPSGTAHTLIAPYQVFKCADGGLALGGANQTNWEKIAQVLDHPEWITDPRFESGASRLANQDELSTRINAVMAGKTVAQWNGLFDEAGVPAGPVQDMGQALTHPQTRAVGMVIDADAPDGGTTPSIGLPVLFDGQVCGATSAPPAVGQDTRGVLTDFGFELSEIDALLADGVVFQSERQSA